MSLLPRLPFRRPDLLRSRDHESWRHGEQIHHRWLHGLVWSPIGLGTAGDARPALQTALEIQQGMAQLNEELAASGEPPMALRLGIHAGPVLADSMVCSERLEYAVIGDTVNCASRLESIEKERHNNLCRVLISDVTPDLLAQEATAEDEEWISCLIWMDWGLME